MRGLYVHIPFCVRKCFYCDFYSMPASLETRDAYIQALLKEAELYAGMSFETMYFGGGTPSILGSRLADCIHGLGEVLDLSRISEATVEVNPESGTAEFMQAVKQTGINRLSIGVQSLDDNELRRSGRIHTAVQALKTIELAKETGFGSVSADVIIGLPGQTWLTLERTLETLVQSGIEHISAYCLALEEGTPLAENTPRDLPSDDTQVELFGIARILLERYGFIHYEISNFTLKGFECLHNLNYWRGGDYLGLGPAAASHLDGVRFRNRADLEAYLENPGGQKEDIEELGRQEKAAEEAMLRLRLLEEGLDMDRLLQKFGRDDIRGLIERVQNMVQHGQLDYDGSVYRLPRSRVLTSNPVFAEVIGIEEIG